MTFEEAFAKLQAIVQLMESDQLKVDDLSDYLKEATALAHFCEVKLRTVAADLDSLLKDPE
jgi:exodeoxyribonuclease VII small subunit